jgi:hypothetical protein
MINTKQLTPERRKELVEELRKEHQPYFDKVGKSNAVYLPKLAYKPGGKDEKHISFFESELRGECDIYTEFVSKMYDSEDPKRTLYLVRYNPFWKEEYEIRNVSGWEKYFIPVSELKVINDMSDRIKSRPVETAIDVKPISKIADIENSIDMSNLIKALEDINYSIQTLTHIIRNK